MLFKFGFMGRGQLRPLYKIKRVSDIAKLIVSGREIYNIVVT